MILMRLIHTAVVWGVAACSSALAEAPLVLAVMDPLAAPLSCPCVEGYAQRDYQVLADSLARRLGRPVRIGFGETLDDALEDIGADAADLVIGKDSVVRADATQQGCGATPIAQLTGKKGQSLQTGLIVVAASDAAHSVSDLSGYRFYFGPSECHEKHSAALALLKSVGVTPQEIKISAACSDGATELLERAKLPDATPAAAVISSYAAPLLEGCGTIEKGDLRVVGETEPVLFITAFVTDRVDEPLAQALTEALLDTVGELDTLRALETLRGFTPIDADYHTLQKKYEAPAAAEDARSAPAIVSPENKAASKQSAPRASPADNASWPGFRGPTRDGVVSWLPDRLPAQPRFVWRQKLSRNGLGGIAVAEGRVVLGDRDPSNQLDLWRCYDAQTGQELWKSRYPAMGRLDYDNAPRATPLIHEGNAYLLGAFGHASCVQLKDGKRVWRRPLRQQHGDRGKLVWGACCSPLLVDDTLIVCPAADRALWLGLDTTTGRERWLAEGEGHAFASPVVMTLGGVRQFVGYDRRSLGGWCPATGDRLWSLAPPVAGDFNVPTPTAVADRLLVVTENNGARLYDATADGVLVTAPLATAEALLPDTSSPTFFGGRIFCVWNQLYCLNANDLSEVWVGEDGALPETGGVIAGHTTEGAGRLLIIGRGGELLLVDADADEFRIVSRLRLFGVDPDEGEDLLCAPAIVGGRLYLRSDDEIVCVDLI
ncbi:outer membrane protein assembly factor BamB family protein [Botrimarina hoheduenensis]|uniref:Outer membrane protein assembly factor BamB n=1 Tax=Botrimarina hoheduenensis TaxID=2528000 RepID=A0A5C5W771_9BACT|nr:PQQ-binding-like beta-propeller repeat protein [Botrimarina hoheduenensis]TWT46746.1 Outer membrane protein assembly factor BamB [Botrimarina hoheduenensis]